MCGRYALWELEMIASRFDIPKRELDAVHHDFKARYNISPTQLLPAVVAEQKQRHLKIMRWGFVAPWMKEPKDTFKYTSFNARSEDIFKKPMWRKAIRETRCIVPANGFYEWIHVKDGKDRYFIRPKDQEIFGFAGVYNIWKDADGLEWPTYSVVTTRANEEMMAVHYRMPVILHPEDEDIWLDPKNDDEWLLSEIMQPYPDNSLKIVKVSRAGNTSRLDDKTLIEPLNSK